MLATTTNCMLLVFLSVVTVDRLEAGGRPADRLRFRCAAVKEADSNAEHDHVNELAMLGKRFGSGEVLLLKDGQRTVAYAWKAPVPQSPPLMLGNSQTGEIETKSLPAIVEKWLACAPPDWWSNALAQILEGNSPTNITPDGPGTHDRYNRSLKLYVQAGVDATRDQAGRLVLRNADSTVAINPAVLVKQGRLVAADRLAAIFAQDRVIATKYSSIPIPCRVCCFDLKNGGLSWTSHAEGIERRSLDGRPWQYVSLRADKSRVFVVGVACYEVFVDGFKLDDGKRVFRFSATL